MQRLQRVGAWIAATVVLLAMMSGVGYRDSASSGEFLPSGEKNPASSAIANTTMRLIGADFTGTKELNGQLQVGTMTSSEVGPFASVDALSSSSCGCQIDIRQRDYIEKKYFEGEAEKIADDIIVKRAWTHLKDAVKKLKACHNSAVAAGRSGCDIGAKLIPFPTMERGRKNDKKYYYVYRIDAYYTSGPPRTYIYKYGIGTYKTNRIDVSRQKCTRKLAGQKCSSRYMVKKIKGWSNARTVEAAYILRYAIIHEHCPPGQPSCT